MVEWSTFLISSLSNIVITKFVLIHLREGAGCSSNGQFVHSRHHFGYRTKEIDERKREERRADHINHCLPLNILPLKLMEFERFSW